MNTTPADTVPLGVTIGTRRQPMALTDEDIRRLRHDTVGDETFAHRFEILREAASGGMSRVFEGTDRESGARVAIKLLLGGEDRVRFAGEADVLERLDHPNIVRYIRHGENRDGVPYLAMEWLTGESLAKRLERGTLSVSEVVTIGMQLAGALQYVHRAQVIHRDLKPSNIYLVPDAVDGMQAKLIDLGIAKHANQDLTQSGQILGTPGYMAPEQARGDKDADARIDLFALGCVLYESLSGRPPFEGSAVMEVLAKLLLETPPALETIVPAIPPRLSRLIAQLMAKDPAHRIASAAIAFGELDAIRCALVDADHRRLAPVSRDGVPTVRGRPMAQPKNRWWLKIVLPILAGTLVGLIGIWVAVKHQRSKCGESRRKGCSAKCEAGDAKACELAAEGFRDGIFKLPLDKPRAISTIVRGCELKDSGVCTRGVALVDAMLKENELPKRTLVPAIERMLATGCELADMPACFQLGFRHTPGVGSLAPDVPRAYDFTIKACGGGLDVACNHLTSMLDAGLGVTAERERARAVRDAACERGVMLCAKSTRGATETAPGGDLGDDATARMHASKLPSMAGEYLDPCYQDDKILHYATALEDSPRGEAWRELARYRNAMSCKHIITMHVPGAHLENDFHRHDKIGHHGAAKEIATRLLEKARAVVVDRDFVTRRLADARLMLVRLGAKAPAQLAKMLADANGEFAAGRIESANLVVAHLTGKVRSVALRETMTARKAKPEAEAAKPGIKPKLNPD
jgi:hypothetical protein